MGRIQLNDTSMSAISKMAKGNPGAVSAMMSCLLDTKTDPDMFMGGLGNILDLDTLGIYGTDIYVLWSDICNKDTPKFIAVLRATQLGFITGDILRDVAGRQDYSWKDMIDVEDLYKKVCERLPNFDKANRAKIPA